jgi:hypothetical protein
MGRYRTCGRCQAAHLAEAFVYRSAMPELSRVFFPTGDPAHRPSIGSIYGPLAVGVCGQLDRPVSEDWAFYAGRSRILEISYLII